MGAGGRAFHLTIVLFVFDGGEWERNYFCCCFDCSVVVAAKFLLHLALRHVSKWCQAPAVGAGEQR